MGDIVMKNKSYLIILFIGIILIIMGAVWFLLGKNTDNTNNDNNDDKLVFSGRYKNSETVLDIYQINDTEAYFVVDDIYGKGTINGNQLLATKNNISYKVSFNDNTINFETDVSGISGIYNKEKTITFDEFFTNNYGSVDYLNSNYNGIFKTEYDDEVDVYQVGENKFLVLCNFCCRILTKAL